MKITFEIETIHPKLLIPQKPRKVNCVLELKPEDVEQLLRKYLPKVKKILAHEVLVSIQSVKFNLDN
jgi:hypothetical protein